jgi:hypothetical protein
LRGGLSFAWADDAVVDSSGRKWDLAKGTCNDVQGEKLVAVTLDMVESERWRAANPDGEVYLISAFDRARTRLVAKGAEGWTYCDGAIAQPDWKTGDLDDSIREGCSHARVQAAGRPLTASAPGAASSG